ncbi:uncharacterized protein LOC120946177 [Rana temporaria]|uniref:uncharacterized protein LOC120946177 n=1 Tax=Rana temporaria TaxID=8407 RepID=UPI001AAE0BF7|nr:uncharacterized protein LOC120946177 [Rana temporaria]
MRVSAVIWGSLCVPLSRMRVSAVIWGSLCLIGAGALRGPSEVIVPYGEELSVTCDYDDGFRSHVKYWCRGVYWKTCEILIKSSDGGSENRYSMEDNPLSLKFIITGRPMRPEDSDTYYCGMEIIGIDKMHVVKVTVLPGVCRETPLWASIVDFPPGFETIEENKVVEVSCKEQYDRRTFPLTCVKESDVFQFYPHPETSSCTRKCGRLMDSEQNISMYPEKEYYDQDEEVTLTCPAGYSPNYSKIRCVRADGTNIWNVTEVLCISSPTVIPIISNHSVSWKDIGVSCCLGVIPPMVVKLITILVILTLRFSVFVQRRSSSVEESPRQTQPDVKIMKSSHRARTNLYLKVTEDQKIPEDAEDDPDLLYANTEVTEAQKIPEDAEDDPDLLYANTEEGFNPP